MTRLPNGNALFGDGMTGRHPEAHIAVAHRQRRQVNPEDIEMVIGALFMMVMLVPIAALGQSRRATVVAVEGATQTWRVLDKNGREVEVEIPSLGSQSLSTPGGQAETCALKSLFVDRFPAWKGKAFVGSMMAGRIRWTGQVQRLTCNDKGLSTQRGPILAERRQRLRDARQGPDGLLYVRTDEDSGALLRSGLVP